MARLKRSSKVVDKAVRRISGMRSISETLDFGQGLSLAEYGRRIQTLQMKLSDYNKMLSSLDEAMGEIALLEEDLSNYSEKMLVTVGTRYGKHSFQYMQAGGKPRQTKKRTAANAKPTNTLTNTEISLKVEQTDTNGKSTEKTTK
ncbi:hypothetical protein NIES37_40940 [Tolypothrix tenuis PCC 7101]|uniref:ATPase involved in DNA repair n=1 Tax=Tolypothrix tenuis PCC 7101 TaxID=231146 RepID=A0A1Z4N340_9CYAN|nr:hypothetical protein [Aulosira sp. FACHB-113]BAZ00111.1 hypothetical protein NIES37_40940 [Tolypothrix tenuis PCC 7101]BAZ75968.1 hypothetical protein NIES50_45650 [Aulosira laxa NIES-50]